MDMRNQGILPKKYPTARLTHTISAPSTTNELMCQNVIQNSVISPLKEAGEPPKRQAAQNHQYAKDYEWVIHH